MSRLAGPARVVVVGTSCVGKTTFARRLARALAVPHVELDALYWGPRWTASPPEVFRTRVAEAVEQGGWVVDGNYSVNRDLIWARATTVIWLDLSFPRVAWRALARTVRRAVRGEELYAGNRESLRTAFLSRESIIWWAVSTFRARRRRYRAVFAAPPFPGLTMIRLRRPREAEAFLRSIEASSIEASDAKAAERPVRSASRAGTWGPSAPGPRWPAPASPRRPRAG
jgi:adenylate kinase family enzyme